jgi:uncharacterized OB-fold protein
MRMLCKGCKQNDFFEFDTVPLPKTGKLLTFTTVYNLPAQYEVATLGLGIVELENGLRMLGQIEIDDPQIGMAVKGSVEVVRKETYDDYYGMVFTAA